MARALTAALAAAALLAGCESGEEEVDFVWMVAEDGALRTTNALPMSISATEDFTLAGPKHRLDTFNDVPFEISLAAFLTPGGAVMIHAEKVADGSGASDYSDLPAADWPLPGFRAGDPICLDIHPSDIDGEHDLEWLEEEGFSIAGGVWFHQYFLSSEDMNDEVVVSLLRTVTSCRDGGDAEQALGPLREAITIGRLQ
jgi:hypothetical protein